jgi:hypothetical protein
MKTILAVALALSVVGNFFLGKAVARLENYRYADAIGFCSEYWSKNDAILRSKREKCLEETHTRTSPIWHVVYALTD